MLSLHHVKKIAHSTCLNLFEALQMGLCLSAVVKDALCYMWLKIFTKQLTLGMKN